MTRRAPFEQRLREQLHSARPPRAAEAERRAWHVVRSAHASRPAAPTGRHVLRLALAALAAAVAAAALALTPAGARVGHWIDDVVSPAPAARDSLALPAPGRLLVVGDGSAWVVAQDGAHRRLGDFADATWSPGGLFVAGARGRELIALEPDSDVHWVRPASGPVSTPRWSPDGFRIAYRSGSDLRVTFGNNEQDWLLARHAAPTPPAWKPLPAPQLQVLAFAARSRVRIVEVDTGRLLGQTPPGPAPREIWWAQGGRLLVTVTARSVRLHSADGRLLHTIDLPTGSVAAGSALARQGHRLAIIARTASGSALLLVRLDRPAPPRRLLDSSSAFAGLSWSTDGSQIVVGRPRADKWLYVPPGDSAGLAAVSRIRERFKGSEESRTGSFPRPAGWCFAEPVDRSTSGSRPQCLPGSAP
jgi:WD40-like Beta Propeller Repeat